MFIAIVNIQVKPEYLNEFVVATKKNANASLKEPGIVRFDILRAIDDPNHFILYEVYKTASDPIDHRNTVHYQEWKTIAEKMMAGARSKIECNNLFPADEEW